MPIEMPQGKNKEELEKLLNYSAHSSAQKEKTFSGRSLRSTSAQATCHLPLGGGETTFVMMDIPASIHTPGSAEAALNLRLLTERSESKGNTGHPKGSNELWNSPTLRH